MDGCSLCQSRALEWFSRAPERPYRRCTTCRLIQVPCEYHLRPEAEKQHYDTHENNPQDAGYRAFLERLCQPLADRLPPGCEGMDFGSGPGPTLALLMEQRGHSVANYDPFYAPDPRLLQRSYDFITLTEVIEHLREPGKELARLWKLIRPGGYLALMTQMTDDIESFEQWYYQRDPTHICFWGRESMTWLASWLDDAEIEFPGRSLSFLRKRPVAEL